MADHYHCAFPHEPILCQEDCTDMPKRLPDGRCDNLPSCHGCYPPDRSCQSGCPRFFIQDEEMCINGQLRSGIDRVDDLGPCLCYCHEPTQDERQSMSDTGEIKPLVLTPEVSEDLVQP